MTRNSYWEMRKQLWNKSLQPGQTLLITEGSCDDFGVRGVATVLREFSAHIELAVYQSQYPERMDEYYYHDYQEFIDWLVGRQLIEIADYREMNLGDYGEYDIYVKPTGSEVANYYDHRERTESNQDV